jgi:hypothetical protein
VVLRINSAAVCALNGVSMCDPYSDRFRGYINILPLFPQICRLE